MEFDDDKQVTLVSNKLQEKFKKAKSKRATAEDFIHEFLGHFLSPQTKRAYTKDLALFFSFLREGGESITHPLDIEGHHFQVYRDHMIEKKMASASINRRLVAIRSFMKWCVAKDLIQKNPLDAVKLPKIQTENPTLAFDDKEVQKILSIPDQSTDRGLVHFMALNLLFHLGLRRTELVNLKFSNIYRDRGHWILRIQGKAMKERHLPLSKKILQEIQTYRAELQSLKSLNIEDDDYILQSTKKGKNKTPMDGSTIYRIVKKYTKLSGIEKRLSPHSCRATVISHLLDTKNTPIRDVAIFAGHANVTTTERYDKRRKGLDDSAAYLVNFDEIDESQE